MNTATNAAKYLAAKNAREVALAKWTNASDRNERKAQLAYLAADDAYRALVDGAE